MASTVELIKDPSFSQKQNQLIIWLRYIGFATWKQVHNVCMSLIEPDSLEIKQWYSSYPIFKMFYPLLYVGIVDIAYNKESEKYGFAIAAKAPLYDSNTISKRISFLSQFEKEDQTELLSQDICKKNALLLLNSIPSLYEQILSWPLDKYLYKGNEYYIRDIFTKKYSERRTVIDEPNIISAYNNGYSSEYVALRNNENLMEFHLLDQEVNCDALNISCCYLKNIKGIPIFEYNTTKKELSCINIYDYSNIPILIQRALLLHDISEVQLINQTQYLRNGIPYTNIEEITIKLIQRIFGINSVKIKE